MKPKTVTKPWMQIEKTSKTPFESTNTKSITDNKCIRFNEIGKRRFWNNLGDTTVVNVMSTVTIQQFQSDAARLLRSVMNGEEIIITEGNVPRVRMSPVSNPIATREDYRNRLEDLKKKLQGMNVEGYRDENDRTL